MTKHLIIGASGQVGGILLRALQQAGETATGTYHKRAEKNLLELDIGDRERVLSFIRQTKSQFIYLPASMTNVDYCETHPDEAFSINVTGVENVITAANEVNAKLIYFSSDYIFDGHAGPYAENDSANPLSVYGRQKLLAEQVIMQHAQVYLIIRTTVVYGWEQQGKNFICRLLRILRSGQSLQVPSDQIGTPTYAPDLVDAAIQLARISTNDTFHVAGPDLLNRYDFSLVAAEVFGLDRTLIHPVLTRDLGQKAPRPLNAGLVVTKAEAVLGRTLVDSRKGLMMLKEQERTG